MTGEIGRERDVDDTVVKGLLAKDFADNVGDGVPERYPEEIGLEISARDMVPLSLGVDPTEMETWDE